MSLENIFLHFKANLLVILGWLFGIFSVLLSFGIPILFVLGFDNLNLVIEVVSALIFSLIGLFQALVAFYIAKSIRKVNSSYLHIEIIKNKKIKIKNRGDQNFYDIRVVYKQVGGQRKELTYTKYANILKSKSLEPGKELEVKFPLETKKLGNKCIQEVIVLYKDSYGLSWTVQPGEPSSGIHWLSTPERVIRKLLSDEGLDTQ